MHYQRNEARTSSFSYNNVDGGFIWWCRYAINVIYVVYIPAEFLDSLFHPLGSLTTLFCFCPLSLVTMLRGRKL